MSFPIRDEIDSEDVLKVGPCRSKLEFANEIQKKTKTPLLYGEYVG